jgi:hypothetical protein
VNTLRASWDGAAQEAYDQAQLKWTKQLNDLNTLLAKIATTTVELERVRRPRQGFRRPLRLTSTRSGRRAGVSRRPAHCHP